MEQSPDNDHFRGFETCSGKRMPYVFLIKWKERFYFVPRGIIYILMGDTYVSAAHLKQLPQQTTAHTPHLILLLVAIFGNNIYLKFVTFWKLRLNATIDSGSTIYPVYRNKYRTAFCGAFQETWTVKMAKVMWTLPWKYSAFKEALTSVNKYNTSWTWRKTRPFFSNDYLEDILKTSRPTPCATPANDTLVSDKRSNVRISS